MAKLTLSVDEQVVKRAKRYATAQGTSVSRIVEGFLHLLAKPTGPQQEPPVLRRLRGALRGPDADRGAYHRYLERKYR